MKRGRGRGVGREAERQMTYVNASGGPNRTRKPNNREVRLFPFCCPFFWIAVAHATRVATHVSPSFNALMRAAADGRYAYMEANGIAREASTEKKFDFWYGKSY